MEKNRLGKSAKTRFFYENTNIVNKKWGGEKREKKFFQKHTISRVLKNGKKSSGKSAKTRFL